ncbi:hypothetical protein HOD20_05885 [archaeon]|jgi:mRNA-degrading endonuclease RelE of RelBE toxin-antitoxin system|nr:hypothetical protein [Candidatus Woesearchaeota archaeon]MBT3463363.1 hypothetical protein [archaeon]MBT4352034.1 hypothetical protein [archaeon]MBT4648018.1 hypothetical protein [archaeon]MBT7392367.1 hypothetical protein [archaeon]
MFDFDISDKLRKKLKKLGKRDKVLARIFYKKLNEVIEKNKISINTYKNLKSPQNEYKRIHLTDNFILIFNVNIDTNYILFIDILHWDNAYKK